MQVLLILLVSALSGIFAGMGMGGGTFLIPLLSTFFGVRQILCQSTNVVCFIFLALICSAVYIKNKLIDFAAFAFVSLPAAVIAFASSWFALRLRSELLHILFAVFIMLVGLAYVVKAIVAMVKQRKRG